MKTLCVIVLAFAFSAVPALAESYYSTYKDAYGRPISAATYQQQLADYNYKRSLPSSTVDRNGLVWFYRHEMGAGSTYSTSTNYGTSYSTQNNYGTSYNTTNNYGPSYQTINNYGDSHLTVNNYGRGSTTVNDYGAGSRTRVSRRRR